ncbi:hypothetical protein ACFQ0T_03100 [Kitasatospora gansuensis]
MEIEVARPLLALDGSNLDGDTEVLLMPGLLKLVSDLRSLEQGDQEVDYSNAEFVTVHFDQHAGTLQEAEAQLDQRLHAVALLMDDLYQDEANRALSAAVRQATATAYETFATARFDPAVLRAIGGVQLPQDALVAPRTYQVPNNELRMLIHYTVGIAPEKLGPALTALGDAARDKSNVGNSAKQHAQRAHAVAQECFGLVTPGAVHPDHVAEFEGFLALVFVQVAASPTSWPTPSRRVRTPSSWRPPRNRRTTWSCCRGSRCAPCTTRSTPTYGPRCTPMRTRSSSGSATGSSRASVTATRVTWRAWPRSPSRSTCARPSATSRPSTRNGCSAG